MKRNILTVPVNKNVLRVDETMCPICGSTIGFRSYLEWEGYRWISCRNCGGGHKEPYTQELEDSAILEKYDQDYFVPAFFERRRKFSLNQANWLKSNFNDGMAVVEIGPGLGLAAEAFLQLFPGTPYHAVEPHPTFADFIRTRLGNRVILHSGNPERALNEALELATSGNRPILLYMDSVLEHVTQPYQFIQKLMAKMSTGSRALFDVPNERGLKYRAHIYKALGGQPTVYPGHINLFTTRSFSMMLSKLGFQCYKVRQRGIRYREEVNNFPEGPVLDLILLLLRVFPVDTLLGIGNNLRIEVEF